MIEFVVIFIVTFIVIIGVTAAMVFGRPPVYRPDIAHVQSVLTRMLEGGLSESEWDFFIEMPIRHDERLDRIRLSCQQTNEQYSLRAKSGNARMKEGGLIRLRFLLNQLESDGSKTF